MHIAVDRFTITVARQVSGKDDDLIAACDRVADWHKLRPINPMKRFIGGGSGGPYGVFWREQGSTDEEVAAIQKKVSAECEAAVDEAVRRRFMR